MKLLALETAFEPCSVALWQDGECLERYALEPRGHAGLVLPWVDELLAESGLALQSLDAVAFSRGPGSFTSLRIGISAVQGLAWGAGLPVVPVSSLRATAQAVATQGVRKAIVAMDARMGEVFAGAFALENGIMAAAGDERVCAPEDVTAPDTPGWAGVGNGFTRYEALEELAPGLGSLHADTWPRASIVATLAADWLASNEGLPAEAAQPVYLRDKVAEKPANKQ